jgi:hypothetical protein
MSEFDFLRYKELQDEHLGLFGLADVIIISGVTNITDQEITETLTEMKRADPDSYALLTEHVPIPEHLLPS